ncbi:MAG: hypothetical protein EXQ48_05210 [Acidobacteria bacterium]|nr:hypothetical protein [Acidobacteriota bacterium]
MVGAGLIWLDHADGPIPQYPVMYVIPVSLAAWYSGRSPALALAGGVPFMHCVFLMTRWNQSGDLFALLGPAVFRAAVIVVMALWFARLAKHERKVHVYVEQLEGLLPIFAFRNSIRNQTGEWEPNERFIANRSKAEFSHSFCKSCGKIHYPDFDCDASLPPLPIR